MGVIIIHPDGTVEKDGFEERRDRYQPGTPEMERRPTIYDIPQPNLQIVPTTPIKEQPIMPFYRIPDRIRTPKKDKPVLH